MQQHSIRILHVDDDAQFADLTATLLEREDDRFVVDTALSASEGIDSLRDRSPDCIVSDYDMPGRNGIEFLQTVRDEWLEIPFILFTGKGSEEVAGRAISAGVTDYLQKKSSSEQYALLANRIINAVERKQTSEALTETQERYQSLRTELIEVSIKLLESKHQDIDNRIEQALEQLGTHVGADRTYIFQIDRTEGTLSYTHEWCADGVTPQIDSLQNIPLETFPWWMEQLKNFETISIPNVSALPEEASTEKEVLQEQNISSLIAAPMISEQELVGFVGFDWVDSQDVWEQEFVDILHIAGRLITNALRQESRQREIEQREERFHALVEESNDIISVVDTDERIQYQSPSVERILGYDPEETIGDIAWENIHPDDRDAFQNWFKQHNAVREQEKPVEYRAQHADGSWRWMEARSHNQLDNPAVEGYVINTRDITERKEREKELAQYKTYVEETSDTIAVVDSDGTIKFHNATVRGESEFLPLNAEGETGFDYVHPEDQEQIMDLFITVLEKETHEVTTELRVETTDDEWRWIEARGVNKLDDPDIEGIIVTSHDITERKERERDLQRRNEQLDEFASVISHDLRNPLNIAELRTDLAAQECESDHLADVTEALSRMDALIDGLLTLARQGDTVGEREQILLKDTVSACWRTVETGDATITIDRHATLAADRGRLKQVLENLFRNAIEHGDESVTVTVGVLDNEGGFYVADDGPGIPEENRKDVFNSSHTTSHDGRGFGLAIVKQICEGHGWDISVTESETGGARFEITGIDSLET
jgi:PAS domain S-box-containing protein